MKTLLKENNSTSFYNHGANLIYYCIKHNFNEEQVRQYLEEQSHKCIKLFKL